jgi:hypothetical protein
MEIPRRRRKSKVKITAMVLSLLTFAVSALAADPFLGTWKRNVAKSTSTLGAVPEQTNIVEAIPGGYLLKLNNPGRAPIEVRYVLDGRPRPIPSPGEASRTSGADARVASRLTDHGYEIKFLRQGKVVATTMTELSQDGKTVTVNTDGVDTAGAKFHILWVQERQ